MTKLSGKDLVRFVAKIDTAGSCWEWRSALNANGYGSFHVGGRTYLAHRLAFELFNEVAIPKGLLLDHTCHNKLCVRPDHLRTVTAKQNAENRKGLPSTNRSGVLGVSWNMAQGKWVANVMHNGKRYFCGYFMDIADAESAVKSKRNLLFTHNEMDRN